tara:strand:+ start:254 stop:763 length:510 start_codon:yes stop_codon:yes gene_type:complete
MRYIFAGIREEALIASSCFFILDSIYTVKNSRVHFYAKKNKLKFFLVHQKNKKEIFKKLEKNRCKVIFSAGFPYIFPKDVIKTFKIKINSHPSLLPKNKGLSPIKEVYFSDKKKIGVTLHNISSKVDSGKIIYQDYIYKKKLPLSLVYQLIFQYLEPLVITKGIQKILK